MPSRAHGRAAEDLPTGVVPAPLGGPAVPEDLNVLALFKGAERFIFVYDDASRAGVVAAVRDAASDPRVSLTWADAAVLTDRARRQVPDAATTSADRLPVPPAR